MRDILGTARASGSVALDEPSGKSILASFGVAVPVSKVLALDEDCSESVAAMTPPFAVKLISSEVLHKSDVGGVRLGLRDSHEVAAAISSMQALLQEKGVAPQAWLIEEMVPSGLEIVVGGLNDAEFGPMIMAGLGGVFVEILKDIVFRICPICEQDARSMIEELRGAPLLAGARGRPGVNVDAVVDVLMCVGGEGGLLMECHEHLAEVDINPLIVGTTRAVAVDARLILKSADFVGNRNVRRVGDSV